MDNPPTRGATAGEIKIGNAPITIGTSPIRCGGQYDPRWWAYSARRIGMGEVMGMGDWGCDKPAYASRYGG